MSQQSSNPEKPELTERQQKMINLVNSFKSSLKQQDLWTAADIASQLIHFTNRPNERQDLLKTGVIDYVIKLIDSKYYQRERLMVHCSWILFNIASEDHNTVNYLIDRGVAKKGVSLLRHPNHEVKQNAAGFLANILADTEFRDIFLKEGIVKQIEWLFQSVAPRPSMLKNMTFLVSNLLKGKPYPPFDQVAPLIKYLSYILLNVKNKKYIEIIIDALWGFSYLTDGENRQIDRVYEFDLIPTIISLTQIPLTKLQAPVIRIIGNTLSGPTRYIDAFLQNGLLEVYSGLLEHPTKSFRKEVCWGISNIMAEDSRIIQHLFDFNDGQIIKKLVIMMSAEEQDLADEIFYCFTNACMTANIQQLYELINLGLIELLISRLGKASQVKYIRLCLEALESVLEMFDSEPDFALMSKDELLGNIVDFNGMEVIKDLQNDDVPAISQIASRILENHFNYNAND